MLRATKFLPSPKVSSPIWICISLSLSDRDWNICRTCMKQAGSLILLCINSGCVRQPVSQCAQSFYVTAEDSQFHQVSLCSAISQGSWVLACKCTCYSFDALLQGAACCTVKLRQPKGSYNHQAVSKCINIDSIWTSRQLL